jgi:competence ComEA-like helix-hairpin-helix protein
VKIDPKSIGVGQYQHDLSEHKLSRSLDAVVEDCVNAVGVDVNTASAPLLARVSGIGAGLAQNIVLHRDTNGRFRSRKSLKQVPRLGPKAFEQCAGFLRIPSARIRSTLPVYRLIRWSADHRRGQDGHQALDRQRRGAARHRRRVL